MYPKIRFNKDLILDGVVAFERGVLYSIAYIDKEFVFVSYPNKENEVAKFPRSELGKLFNYV